VRPSHAEQDGEVAKVGERFANGCEYPGDPTAPADETVNCRCALIAQLTPEARSRRLARFFPRAHTNGHARPEVAAALRAGKS
jgi:hypothetical protein